jgi:Txe/YoeB family toxin of Txe-Axe toxin-antitoxin module
MNIIKPLKSNYQGYWSTRISDEHRIIYGIFGNNVEFIFASGQYNDK